jgi:GNAT superfamily N-acetyltransferase
VIRAARADDAERLRAVEVAAGARFREVGMPAIADADPMPVDGLVGYAESGRSWVAVGDGDDVAVAYVVVHEVDGCAHVEQLSVAPEHQGRGLGRALLHRVEAWAVAHGMPALTLTTFRDVPWNRPLYEHLGFRTLAERELTPGLHTVREEEAGMGLDPSIRVCMRRAIGPTHL